MNNLILNFTPGQGIDLLTRVNNIEAALTGGLAVEGPAPITVTATTGQTLTPGQMLSPLLIRAGATVAGFNDTTPTAAQLVAAVPGVPAGNGFVFRYRNTTGFTSTLVAGTGVTLAAGNTNTTATLASHLFYVHFLNVTPGSEAVTIYSLSNGVY